MTEQYLRIKQAVSQYPFTEPFLRKVLRERRLPFHKVGSAVWLKRADLEEFIERGRVEARGASR